MSSSQKAVAYSTALVVVVVLAAFVVRGTVGVLLLVGSFLMAVLLGILLGIIYNAFEAWYEWRVGKPCPPCNHDCNQGRNCPLRKGK